MISSAGSKTYARKDARLMICDITGGKLKDERPMISSAGSTRRSMQFSPIPK